jgi:hypothetical protein
MAGSMASGMSAVLDAVNSTGSKDTQLAPTMASLKAMTNPPKGAGVFPSTSVDPSQLTSLMDNTTAIVKRAFGPEWLKVVKG